MPIYNGTTKVFPAGISKAYFGNNLVYQKEKITLSYNVLNDSQLVSFQPASTNTRCANIEICTVDSSSFTGEYCYVPNANFATAGERTLPEKTPTQGSLRLKFRLVSDLNCTLQIQNIDGSVEQYSPEDAGYWWNFVRQIPRPTVSCVIEISFTHHTNNLGFKYDDVVVKFIKK